MRRRIRLPGLCAVQGDRGADQRLEGALIEVITLVDIDRAPGVTFKAGVEQFCRVLELGALGERELDDAPVRLAGADDAIVRPDRNASPLPLLDHFRVRLFDEGTDMRKRLAPPVAQF